MNTLPPILASVVILGLVSSVVADAQVANNTAALQAISSTKYISVTRLGFSLPGDGGRRTYVSTNAPCSVNGGNGDDETQIKSADNKCWVSETLDLGTVTISGGTIGGISSLEVGTDQRPGFFGTPLAIIGTSNGTQNAFVGEVTNNLSIPTLAFPTGVTGYGNENSPGNQAFGVFGLGELRSTSGGVVIGGEFTARNFSGSGPDTNLPPNTAIGTLTNVATGENVTCGVDTGTSDCSIGVYIANENGNYSSPIFNTGLYLRLFRQYGIVVESQPTGNQASAVLKNNGTGINLQLLTTGVASPNNTVLTVQDATGVNHASIRQNGDAYVNNLFLKAAMQLTKIPTASLPACGSSEEGWVYAVTDSNSTTFNATFSGGGRNHVIAYCNGANWVVH
jgi:hypothetical protein